MKDRDFSWPAFAAFCAWPIEQGANGLAVFGTTSEANSLSLMECMSLLEHCVAGGSPGGMPLPGTGARSLPEAIRVLKLAHALGSQ